MEANEIKKILEGCNMLSEGIMAIAEGAKKDLSTEDRAKVDEEIAKAKKEIDTLPGLVNGIINKENL
jgi:hypothetical protein